MKKSFFIPASRLYQLLPGLNYRMLLDLELLLIAIILINVYKKKN
jgi:hypothetical protein